jgi:hypothetical protein
MSVGRPDRRPRDRRDVATDPIERWDWSSTAVVLLFALIVLALTFDVWSPLVGWH